MQNLQVILIRDYILSRNALGLDRINLLRVDWKNNISSLEYERDFLALKECVHVCHPVSKYPIDPHTDYLVVIHELRIKTSESSRVVLQGFLHERDMDKSLLFLDIFAEEEFDEVEDELLGYELIEDLSLYFYRASNKRFSLEEFVGDLLKYQLYDEIGEIETFLGRSFRH